MRNRKLALLALVTVTLCFLASPVHGQVPTFTATDRSAYVPGDTGTLTFTITNTLGGGQNLEIRNITIYYPWAGYGPDGNYQGNTSIKYYPYKVATSSNGGGTTFTDKTSFSVPPWYSGVQGRNGACPETTNARYNVQYGSCILVGGGSNGYGTAYAGTILTVSMATPTYTPVSLVSMTIPIITIIVLAIIVAVLVLVWRSVDRLRRDMKK